MQCFELKSEKEAAAAPRKKSADGGLFPPHERIPGFLIASHGFTMNQADYIAESLA